MYKAIMDRIIVCLNECPQTNVITPENRTRNRGKVIDVGERVHGVHKGDEIIFHVFDEMPLPKKDWVVVREKSVLGIIDN